MIERLFAQILPAIDSVNGLQRLIRLRSLLAERLNPGHEALGFIGQPDAEQGVDGEGGIANPATAVIPVALATDTLRQTGGGRRHNRAGRFIDQKLQRQRGALHHLAPAAGVIAFANPVEPVVDGLAPQSIGFLLLERARGLFPGVNDLQDEAARFALIQA